MVRLLLREATCRSVDAQLYYAGSIFAGQSIGSVLPLIILAAHREVAYVSFVEGRRLFRLLSIKGKPFIC